MPKTTFNLSLYNELKIVVVLTEMKLVILWITTQRGCPEVNLEVEGTVLQVYFGGLH